MRGELISRGLPGKLSPTSPAEERRNPLFSLRQEPLLGKKETPAVAMRGYVDVAGKLLRVINRNENRPFRFFRKLMLCKGVVDHWIPSASLLQRVQAAPGFGSAVLKLFTGATQTSVW